MSVRMAVAALAAALAGCSDSGPDPLIGSVEFSYSGASGSPFSVSGAMPAGEQAAETSDWATGFLIQDVGVAVFAQRAEGGPGSNDLVIVGVDRKTAGVSQINGDTDCEADLCAGLAMILGASGTLCFLDAGAVSVTEVSSSRMKGSFDGSGQCVDFTSDDTTAFTATAGTFDVALRVDGSPFGALRAGRLTKSR